MRKNQSHSDAPRLDLARKTLPAPLLRALIHIFEQSTSGGGAMLVGGTALAGFYAGHRRSDDLDLFVSDETAQRMAVLATKSLTRIGTQLLEESSSQQYYHATCLLDRHRFTVDVVTDPNLFRIGTGHRLEHGICVADLRTLLKTKIATLVSRCSEKDLYDLIWLFEHSGELSYGEMIALGHEIDAGVNGENLLLSVGGATLSKSACDFSLDPKITAGEIFTQVTALQSALTKNLSEHLRKEPALPLKKLVTKIRKFTR